MGPNPEQTLHHRGGDVLHCVHALETPSGCGHSAACEHCVIRNAVKTAFTGAKTTRHVTNMRLSVGSQKQQTFLLVTAAPFEQAGHKLVVLVLENIDELIQLRKILPICARCKKIRNDKEFWTEVETYFNEHLDMLFSHSICPDCLRVLYPEFADEVYPSPHQA
jgi:hypothetical protein